MRFRGRYADANEGSTKGKTDLVRPSDQLGKCVNRGKVDVEEEESEDYAKPVKGGSIDLVGKDIEQRQDSTRERGDDLNKAIKEERQDKNIERVTGLEEDRETNGTLRLYMQRDSASTGVEAVVCEDRCHRRVNTWPKENGKAICQQHRRFSSEDTDADALALDIYMWLTLSSSSAESEFVGSATLLSDGAKQVKESMGRSRETPYLLISDASFDSTLDQREGKKTTGSGLRVRAKSNGHVQFAEQIVSEVRERPLTEDNDVRELFYTLSDIERFEDQEKQRSVFIQALCSKGLCSKGSF